MFKKLISALISTAIFVTAAVGCTEKTASESITENTETAEITVNVSPLSVTFFDVGKADSMAILTENSTVIIDCGEKGDGKEIIQFLEENGISAVDYLIITHYDKDHVGGAAKVINNVDVINVLAPDYDEESSEMEKYEKALSENNITPQLLTSNISFKLDDAEFTVYAPEKTDYGENDDNDFSLVTKVIHGNNTLLFTGDAMEQRLEEIMDIGDCDFLKVPYHGRKLDNLEQFLNAVNPEYAAVCTSQSEFAASTQSLLTDRNIEYYSTCYNGRIELVSDGNTIEITPEKGNAA